MLGGVKRVTCILDGTGYAFLAWYNTWETAYTNYAFEEMDRRGLKIKWITQEAEANQGTIIFVGGVAKTWEDRYVQSSRTSADRSVGVRVLKHHHL